MNKMLLLVDPQIDFIDGTLPVAGAPEAMNNLAARLVETDGEYVCKVVTTDAHPYRHCSFADCGGKWPRHCVADTVGAAIWPALVDPLYRSAGEVTVLHKGTSPDTEEYSIFANTLAANVIGELVERHHIDRIDICGLAGDICVLNTLSDGVEIFGPAMFNVLLPFSPSLDGGEALNRFIAINNISCDR